MNKNELLNKLEKYGDGFEDWRYFFENKGLEGNLRFLSDLLYALDALSRDYYLQYTDETGWIGRINDSVILSEEKWTKESLLEEIHNPANIPKYLANEILKEKITNGTLNKNSFESNESLEEKH